MKFVMIIFDPATCFKVSQMFEDLSSPQSRSRETRRSQGESKRPLTINAIADSPDLRMVVHERCKTQEWNDLEVRILFLTSIEVAQVN